MAALAASRLSFVLSGLVVNLAMVRWLPVETFGTSRWILAVVALAAAGSNLGLGAWVTRTLAREPERAPTVVPAVLRLVVVLAVLTGFGVVAYVGARDGRPWVIGVAALGALTLVAQGMTQIVEAAVHGLHHTRREVAPALAGRLLLVVGSVGALLAGGGLVPLFAVRAAAQALTGLWLLRELSAVVGGLAWRKAEPPAGELLHIGRAFAATVLFSAMSAQADVLVLEVMRGEAEVARYGAGASILLQIGLAANILSRSFFPVLARLHGDPQAFRQVLAVQGRWLLLVSLPIAVGGVLVGADLVPWLFGAPYADAVVPFVLLMLVVPLRFLHNGLALALTALDGQASRARVDVVAGLFNVGINLVVIPRWGAEGAACTTLATDLLILGMIGLSVRGRVGGTGTAAALWRLVPAVVVMGAVVVGLAGAPVWGRVVVGAVVYGGVAWVSGAWAAGDREVLGGL